MVDSQKKKIRLAVSGYDLVSEEQIHNWTQLGVDKIISFLEKDNKGKISLVYINHTTLEITSYEFLGIVAPSIKDYFWENFQIKSEICFIDGSLGLVIGVYELIKFHNRENFLTKHLV